MSVSAKRTLNCGRVAVYSDRVPTVGDLPPAVGHLGAPWAGTPQL